MAEPAQRKNGELAVLILAPRGRDARLACQLLDRHGVGCVECPSVGDLVERIADGCGPAVLAEEALTPAGAADLNARLDAQPNWSDLPLVILQAPRSRPERVESLATRPNTTLLRRPLHIPMFLSIVRSAVESRRGQYEIRDLLRDLRQLNARLGERAGELQKLALQLTETEERERRRLADLLHDDLQQLLVAAGFQLQALLRHTGDPERLDEVVRELRDLLQRAISVSRNLSHELSPPVLDRGGLAPAVQGLIRHMRELHGLRVHLEADPEAEPRDRRISSFLFRAVQELLFNAVKHAGAARAEVHLRRVNEWSEVTVQDNGRGFDPSVLHNGRRSTEGYGLFSIRERIGLLGGRMVIDAAPGSGARFRMLVPLRPAEATRARSKRAPAAATTPAGGAERPPSRGQPSPRLRVMLVDDHRVMRQGIKAMLALQPDIEILAEADNGREALDMADRFDPDVIVMDVSMPEMDGVEATRRIKDRRPHIRIIGLSMFEEADMAQEMIEAGAEVYLPKTGPSGALIAAVRDTRPAPKPHGAASQPTGRASAPKS